jgi:hypothetical protein
MNCVVRRLWERPGCIAAVRGYACLLALALLLCARESGAADYTLCVANLHLHTRVSGSDHRIGVSPRTELALVRLYGLACAGLSDHPQGLTPQSWAEEGRTVAAETTAGFVALRGFEWTAPGGKHLTVFGTTEYRDAHGSTSDEIMADMYAWLEHGEQTGAIVQLNHPWWADDLDALLRRPASWTPGGPLDREVRLIEVGSGRAIDAWLYGTKSVGEACYRAALRAGWHVAPTIGHDNTGIPDRVSRSRHAGLWVRALSQEGVLEALRARRLFAAEDRDMVLRLQAEIGGVRHEMGEVLATHGLAVTFLVTSTDTKAGIITYVSDLEGRRLWEAPAPGNVRGARFTLSDEQIRALPANPEGERLLYLVLARTGEDTRMALSAPFWLVPASAVHPPVR